MKISTIIYAIIIAGSLLFTSSAYCQNDTRMSSVQLQRMDSLASDFKKAQAESRKDNEEDYLSDLKKAKSDAKIKLREARHVECRASDAVRETRNAYRTEKRAQKARRDASAQARKKAARAKEKSDDI